MICSLGRAVTALFPCPSFLNGVVWNPLAKQSFVSQQKWNAGSEPMADERDTEERVTIVDTNGGGGSGGVLAVVLLVIVVLVLLFLFRDQLGFGGDKTDINIPDKIDVNVN
jgi:hypothetical protein